MMDEITKEEVRTILNSSLDIESIVKMCEIQIFDKTMSKNKKNLIDNTMEQENGQKMTVGLLVRHRTVGALGLGLIVSQSKAHKGFWMVKWCDERYCDVGSLGIAEEYLEIV